MPRKYYLRYRPPFIGTHPNGNITTQVWSPAKIINHPAAGKMWAHGWVEYDEPLPLQEVFKYELFPENVTEAAYFMAWLDADRDLERSNAILAEYLNLDFSTLIRMVKNYDTFAAYALTIKENQPR